MRKIYAFLLFAFAVFVSNAQDSVCTNHVNNNGASSITFNIKNNSTGPIQVQEIKSSMFGGTGGTYSFQLLYNTTAINQSTTPWSAGTVGAGQNGWVQAANVAAVTIPTHTAPVTVLTGLNIVIPAGATYGFALATSGTIGYETLTAGAGVNTFTSNSVSILTGDGIGWGGGTLPGTPVNYPRGFIGCAKWVAFSPCTGTPNAGTTVSSITNPCPTQNFVLSLNGVTQAAGLTFQWQSSPNGTTWTNIPSGTSGSLTTSQTTSTYYRAIVACGANSDTSTHLQVTSPGNLAAGTYTINGTLPASATNFQTFGAAVAALNCGIAGPVIFNVATATYNEQVTIPAILNTSSVNTVRFNGNGATLMSSPTSTNPAGIRLNGSDHVIIDSLTVNVASGTYGWGILLMNKADSNQITRNTIITSTTSTLTNFIGILINGSATVSSTAGDNGNGNLISGNTITGGYYGIEIYGSTTPYNANNSIIGNTVKDFYFYGIYNYGNDNLLVSKNDISRPTRTSVSTTYGVYISTNSRVKVEKNKVHDVFAGLATPTTSVLYCYYLADDGTATQLNFLENNMVYNIKKTNGTVYGVYCPFYTYWRIYHNSIVFDDAAATAGTTYGMYVYGTAIEVKNNIIFITRGGTGTKYVVSYPTTTATAIPTSNNNVLYINAPAGTNYIGQIGTTNYTTLAAWQAANGGIMDQQSMSVDPQFANPATGILYPNNSAIANIGAAVGVLSDIVETPRSTSGPTPGAFEILPIQGTDVGINSLFSPIQKQCYSNAENVTVVLKNYSANTHNFATVPVTVNVSVTGPNATTFTPVVVNTGTLASQGTLNVLISNSYNMSAGGSYVFSASTTATGDGNAFNNAMQNKTINDTTLEAGVITSNPSFYCVTGGIPNLTLSNGGGGTIQWQESATGLPGSWVNVGTNTTSYTPPAAITATRYYRVYRTCSGAGDTSLVNTVSVNNPQLLTTTPGTRCGPGTVTLSATGSAGASFNWYPTATGGAPLFTGAAFTTPVLNNNTTYYVSAAAGGNSSTVGLSPTATNCGTIATTTATDWPLRFNTTSPITINSAWVIPAAAGTLTVALRQSLSTVNIQTASFTFTAAQVGVPQQITLNFSIPNSGSYQLTNTVGGIARIGTFTCAYPFTSAGGGFSIVGSATLSTLATSTTQYNGYYNINVSEGCESARQAVTATVTPAPAFDVTANLTACNNAITSLGVTSPMANFNNYTWTPVTGLYTDAAATIAYTAGSSASTVYAKIATAGTYTYVATANNTTSGCQNIDSLKLTVLPATVSVVPVADQLCVSGSTTIGLSPNPSTFGSAGYQWYTSPNNTTYTAIAGETNPTYTTPTISATTYYKVDIKNSAGQVCLSPYDTVKVNSPQVISTTPAALCNPGSMTLGATANAGSTINWYTAATGGTMVGTGNTFTTPVVSTTTTYYAAAVQGGGGADVGIKPSEFAICGTPVSTTLTDYPLRFNTTKSVVINSAYVIPAAAGTFTVALRNALSTTNLQTSTPVTFTAAQVGIPQQINLNFSIATAGSYQLTNITGGVNRITVLGCGYPFTTPTGGFSIVGSASTSTSATVTTFYNSFYQLNVTEACESPRTAVVAQVSSNTAITSNPLGSISTCVGSSMTLTVGATGANLSYQWRKNGVPIANTNNDSLVLNPVTLGDAGTYDVVITGLCGPAVTSGVSIVNVSAANTWLGKVSTDWNDVNNWCGGIPTSTTDVMIFPGTPYQPVVTTIPATVKTLTVGLGAIVIVSPGSTISIYGNFVNNGTFSSSNASIFFRGTALQSVDEIVANNITINGAGVNLNGNMTAHQTVTLTAGHVNLGISNLTAGNFQNGSLANHIVTNSSGSVVVRNVTAGPVTVPIGPSDVSYNPVTIANGGGKDYSVRVATGLAPTVANPSRAVNRTWNISPNSAPSSAATITLQYADAHMNTPGVPTNPMEVGVHNGTAWTVVTPNVTPTGSATARQVISTTNQFGAMAIANIGGVSWITAINPVDATINSMQLMPNIIESNTMLRIVSTRTTKVRLEVIDANGRVVLNFDRQIIKGQNDLLLEMSKLAAGSYMISGSTDKGKTQVLRFVKL